MFIRLIALTLSIHLLSGCSAVQALLYPYMPAETGAEALHIVGDSDLLTFTDFHFNEARFNPSAESPVALNIMSSTTFHNASGERLAVRFPRFKLEINGVHWTDLASTDFQIGRLQANASQTIELQSLLLMKNVSEEQQPVLEAIQGGEALSVRISGTILIFPDSQETVVNLDIAGENIILPSAWLLPAREG